MNKSSIKTFAIWARNKLIADISYKAGLLGISEKEIEPALSQSTNDVQFFAIGSREPYKITGIAISQRKALADKIDEKARQTDYATAYKTVIEEVAYTWFNRLIAIRFMEVNEYLPSGIRVLSSDSGKAEPDIVSSPFETDLVFSAAEREYIIACKTDNKLDELFRMLFIKQCNALNNILPELFEPIGDYAELLLNISFTDKDGVVYRLVFGNGNEKDLITEDDFKEAVEIIGWLYQYYNTEPKDETFALLKKNVKITKERIPAATQLFTPHWIVRYMVENSLGRLWLEGIETRHCGLDPQSPARKLRTNWKYYLDEAEQTPEVEAQLEKIRAERQGQSPEDITFLDPCMGSGHILIYAFDVFMQIYESAGYNQRDAAKLILEKNLHGLDIDKRAYQLAYFALFMKARKYNSRIFENPVAPQVYHPAGWPDGEEYGSLIKIDSLGAMPQQYLEDDQSYNPTYNDDLRIWNFKRLLVQKFDVVVTNPPYMGSSGMNGRLSQFVKDNFPDSKSDLFAVFIEKCGTFTIQCGLTAMITQHAWMFLSSYEKLRIKLRLRDTMNMAHLGARAFAEIGGEVVQSTTLVMRDKHTVDFKGSYIRLVDINDAELKEQKYLEAIANPDCDYRYSASADKFAKIPGSPVAYWVSAAMLATFGTANTLLDVGKAQKGLDTCDVDAFVRKWFEVSIAKIGFDIENCSNTFGHRWFPYSKGGEFRRWYGNNINVVLWEDDGYVLRNLRDGSGKIKSRPQNTDNYFFRIITWSAISSSKPSMRMIKNSIYGGGGTGYLTNKKFYYQLAFLNSFVAISFLSAISPTLNYEAGHIMSLPIKFDVKNEQVVENIVKHNIFLSQEDWDKNETSYGFSKHPLV